MKYIWQQKGWPQFTWDAQAVAGVLSDVSYREGRFLGKLSEIGFESKTMAGFESLASEIVSSAAIEGESLNRDDVRSSVARRMEIVLGESSARPDSHALDARVDMMMDATRGWQRPMSVSRLKAWHAALFPTGYSGLVRVAAGRLRDDSDGPMQVVSRHGSMTRVHFEAPPSSMLSAELKDFVRWLGADKATPPLVKVALAHLRFLTLHPFDDGNGRLARALTEYLLARFEQSDMRFYSLSSQIQKEKAAYYDELEHAQRNTLDVTRWIVWFLSLQNRALTSAAGMLEGILAKADFWRRHSQDGFNEHQREMLNRLLDGFVGNLTSSKWAKICKISQDTASREISVLVSGGILRSEGGGRSTHYVMNSSDEKSDCRM